MVWCGVNSAIIIVCSIHEDFTGVYTFTSDSVIHVINYLPRWVSDLNFNCDSSNPTKYILLLLFKLIANFEWDVAWKSKFPGQDP